MKQYDVISAGLAVMDILITGVDRDIFDVDTHHLDKIVYATGGDAFNVAINLANLGAKVRFAGCIGDDASGTTVRQTAKNMDIDTSMLIECKGMNTSTSIVLCETRGERHFLHCPGANLVFDGEQLTEKEMRTASILFIGSVMGLPGLENGKLLPLLKRAHACGLTTVMDACGGKPDYDTNLLIPALRHVDVFIPSFDEALQITGCDNAESASKFLLEHGVKLAGVKLGGDGCYITDGEHSWSIPCYKVESPMDTTGAGDSFMSGFIRGMLLGLSWDNCARMGSAVSHNCIQYVGATTHASTLKDIKSIMESN